MSALEKSFEQPPEVMSKSMAKRIEAMKEQPAPDLVSLSRAIGATLMISGASSESGQLEEVLFDEAGNPTGTRIVALPESP